MAELSSNLLLIAFYVYLASTILFAVSLTGKKFKNKAGEEKNKSALLGYISSVIALLFSLGYFITRWIAAGHAPVSNLFEYTTFFGIMMALAFVIIYPIYKLNVLGFITMPIVMLIIAYASMFPSEISPLIPALQSYWLKIHVITTALGQGILAIGFAGGLIYLLRVIDFKKNDKQVKAIEFVLYSLISVIGFILITSTFNALNYEAQFSYINEKGIETEMAYNLPALVGPNESVLLTEGRMSPFFNVHPNIKSGDLNTVIWSLFSGLVLYYFIRLITRRKVGELIQPLLRGVSPQVADEISYRAIAIGFPIFTLGGLIFAMIWAQIAWTRFWAWDPKEVWALITFLFYAAYLHLRLSRGWLGERSAWLCVIGFAIIMFNLIFVNLVIAGLHSYA
ncbi:cytochrome c biogenesis protein CcsA [Anaerobacillus isosaccharinicus]|uniref:C-type cytochrome biogenesis protein CcsB n=1 Tax=Anaerobacillus isosaccharinicus TaxID=1532552 RepID=A0A1S2M3S6_9BACI|nr:cytochrome c biogenesis protein CcsA [Anaerobacillus isosaccharinicus]MBA5585780.1 cytochrome c biogenesis protein CcsA [Anaerobacillus isosaccharinicus]QOY35921.1 cytochrome c biogenesis protein CcsA [Anaerobacillus isosaccharinicus]